MTKQQELKEIIESYQDSHDDSNTERLEAVFNAYCTEFDRRSAYVYGLLETVNDQIDNHDDDDDESIQGIIDQLTN